MPASSILYFQRKITGSALAGDAARVREELRFVDPELPILKINTAEQQLEEVLVRKWDQSEKAALRRPRRS